MDATAAQPGPGPSDEAGSAGPVPGGEPGRSGRLAEDVWSRWLLATRHGNDPAYQRVVQDDLGRFSARVLEGAQLAEGMTLLDVGSGDGLIAWAALARLGPSLRVILAEPSPPLLRHAQQEARQRQVQGQCTFLPCSAEKLQGVGAATVDAVTTRAVLAYVADKAAALREFHRVLKPAGRVSMAEPIFRDQALETCALAELVAAQPAGAATQFLNLVQRWKAAQFPATAAGIGASPLTNFTERDLVRLAREAGFGPVHLELHMDVRPSSVQRWEVFLEVSPHPWAPPLRAILAERFSPAERRLFEAVLRPQVEAGQLIATDTIAYLTAQKPAG